MRSFQQIKMTLIDKTSDICTFRISLKIQGTEFIRWNMTERTS